MKTMIAIAAVAATMLAVGFAGGTAQAAPKTSKVAKQECKIERATDRAEFIARYGGTGKGAIKRCVRREKREARSECSRERRWQPAEFAAEYRGTGKAAMRRCIIDELR